MENKVTIVGIKIATFVGQDGRSIKYARIHVLYPENSESAEVRGQETESIKADPEFCELLEPGMVGIPVYNKYGKCIGFNA